MARKVVFAAPVLFLVFLLFLPAQQVFAASGNLQKILQQLDASAKNFRTASADAKIEVTQTEPVPNTDVQLGQVYYKHEGGQLQMALHITQQNGQPFRQTIAFSHGVAEVYQENLNQLTRYTSVANFADYLTLGFGATGKDLADKFNITDLGPENIDGVQTEKLQLIAKDPKVLRLFPKITIWIDPQRDVNLKQVFDEGQGMSRTVTYSHIEVNHSIRSSEFTIKTNKSTQITNQ